MPQLKSIRLVAAAIVLAGVPLLAASAQTQTPTAPSPSATPPPAAKPDVAPTPPAAVQQRPVDKSATAPIQAKSLLGLSVFSSDGSKMGAVLSVSAAPDGSAKAIHIKTGGFLGFGGKLVAIPEARFTKSGDSIQLGMTADEVSKLPEMKVQS
jgi:hypothetical protein